MELEVIKSEVYHMLECLGHDYLLDAKGDNLQKHKGWTTAKIDKPKLGKEKIRVG